jgi:hypothetical protein
VLPDSYGTCYLCLLMALHETQILFRSKLGRFSTWNFTYFCTCIEQRHKACRSMFCVPTNTPTGPCVVYDGLIYRYMCVFFHYEESDTQERPTLNGYNSTLLQYVSYTSNALCGVWLSVPFFPESL